METIKTIDVLCDDTCYKIDTDKIIKVVSALESREIEAINDEEIIKLMKKYSLFDKYFLDNFKYL